MDKLGIPITQYDSDESATISSQSATAALGDLPERILNVVLRHRRLIPEHAHLANAPTAECRAPHIERVERAVAANEPLHFVLPAFPGKSSNPEKTLGPLPDLGEQLGIRFLQDLCDRVAAVYRPGARIAICSDGRVFSDLVKIREDDVNRYKAGINELIEKLDAKCIEHFDLDDVYGRVDYDVMREELLVNNGTSLLEIRRMVREGNPPSLRNMFNGIHRFIFEDYNALCPDVSKNQLREQCKTVAYRVIQRSNAWSSLVESRFPASLRLSIHPQSAYSRKIGVMLVPSSDVWGTPWHNAVIIENDKPSLIKRKDAERLGAELVLAEGRPSHFVLTRKDATS